MACGKILAAIRGVAPTEIDRLPPFAVRPIRDIAASSSGKVRRVTASKSFPYSVKTTWRVVRSNRRNPSWFSSLPDCCLSALTQVRIGFARSKAAEDVLAEFERITSWVIMFDISGKSALITGGTSGIGAAIANQLLAAGCHVLAAGLPAEKPTPDLD